jgi:dihydrodipicolinate synthase/N-acetylneuraminate lyase
VKLLEECKSTWANEHVPARLLTIASQITDCNAAFFDAANGFAGCIAGIHEVLRRQGLLANTLCLNPREQLSPGQREEIDRVLRAYPHLNDDEFVSRNLEQWLA